MNGQRVFPAVLALTVLSAAWPARQTRPPADLAGLLDQAAKYCDRLSRSVLDFVCRERVEEWFRPEVSGRTASGLFAVGGVRKRHVYVYDFQLVRDRAGLIRESRMLLQEDKKKLHVPDAPLKTSRFFHARVVMGPLGLLSRERQADHDYRILREERVGQERAFVVEAVPRPGVLSDHLVGTVWLTAGDAGVLKIEWDPSSMDNYAGVQESADRLRMTPRVVLTSEYAFEKNGIRFPSRYTVKEIYVRGPRSFQRSQVDVTYDEYKFFTVETQVVF